MLLKKLLGVILTEMGFVTEQHLAEALKMQRKICREKALPERLQIVKLISEARLATGTTHMLGQVLIDMGVATQDQLDQAMKKQAEMIEVYKQLDSEQLGVIVEECSIINSTLNIAEVLENIMKSASQVTKSAKLTDIRIPQGKGIAGWVAVNERHLIIPDARKDSRFYEKIDGIIGFETKSILCVPLKVKTKLIGVLEVINKADGTSFTKEDAMLLNIYANQAAIAIDNARYYNELKSKCEEEKQLKEKLEEANEELQLQIERREKAEKQMHKLSHAIEHSSAMVVITDNKGNIEYTNPMFTQITGYSLEEVMGENTRVLKSGKTPPGVYKELWGAITSGSEWRGELCNKKKNGECYWEEESISPVKNAEGVITNFIAIKNDITERKQAEEELEKHRNHLESLVNERTRELRDSQEALVRSEKLAMLGKFAGGVGHELRNPLGVINNSVYFLKMVLTDADDKVREYLEKISSEVKLSSDIISSLMAFSRTKPVIEKEEVEIIIMLTLTLERQPVPENIEVKTDIPSDLPAVYVDPKMLEQVLLNLISNGYQAMTEGGCLTITASAGKQYVNLSIADTGTGISPENMEKIFEPLFTTKARGIGFGLALSRNLVESNGGSIEAKSEEGKGTTFTVKLPVRKNVS